MLPRPSEISKVSSMMRKFGKRRVTLMKPSNSNESPFDSEPVRKRVQRDSIFVRGGNVIREIKRTRTRNEISQPEISQPEDPQNKETNTKSRHVVSQRNFLTKSMKIGTKYPQDFDFEIQTNEMKMPDLKFKKNVASISQESSPR